MVEAERLFATGANIDLNDIAKLYNKAEEELIRRAEVKAEVYSHETMLKFLTKHDNFTAASKQWHIYRDNVCTWKGSDQPETFLEPNEPVEVPANPNNVFI